MIHNLVLNIKIKIGVFRIGKSLINKIKNDYLIIHSTHTQTKKIDGIFIPQEMDFRLACAVY